MVSLAKSKFLFLVPALLLFLFFVMTSVTKEGKVIKMTAAQKLNMKNGNTQRANSCREQCYTLYGKQESPSQQGCLKKC